MSTKDSTETDKLNSQLKLDSDGSPRRILEIGKQRTTWQEVLLFFAASLSVVIVFLIFLFTILNGWQIIPEYGLGKYLFGDIWNPDVEFGIFPMIVGTFMVVIVALVLAVPIGISCAIFLSELAHPKIRKIMKPAIELLASIPSIVYGFIALRTIVLFFQNVIGLKTGRTAFTAGLVLSIMILPTIISISDDAIKAVPKSYREGSIALGATKWQTIRKVVVPAAISGLVAAILLGFARAIGETMAVYMIGGGATNLHWNIFTPVDTLTSLIARELGEAAVGSTAYHAIFAAACVLFIITFIVNLIGDLIIRRFSKKLTGGR
ncbi:MAG: phosphate ABC transporter permease subunit PstC [Asgard group archaeon]|nr:phosphate ABC transporter permease subunit PstC [Asgard group archaeon]